MKKNKLPSGTLFLVLSKKWYDMIDSGEKTEEYRRSCPHWDRRLWVNANALRRVVFQCGYRRGAPRATFRIYDIEYVDVGTNSRGAYLNLKPEWGYKSDEKTIVISIGKRITE
jgi:hypothetical protein